MWGATLQYLIDQWIFNISIHAPRVGSDGLFDKPLIDNDLFQSTLPVWGATAFFPMAEQKVFISIHAPRVGSDAVMRGFTLCRI